MKHGRENATCRQFLNLFIRWHSRKTRQREKGNSRKLAHLLGHCSESVLLQAEGMWRSVRGGKKGVIV